MASSAKPDVVAARRELRHLLSLVKPRSRKGLEETESRVVETFGSSVVTSEALMTLTRPELRIDFSREAIALARMQAREVIDALPREDEARRASAAVDRLRWGSEALDVGAWSISRSRRSPMLATLSG